MKRCLLILFLLQSGFLAASEVLSVKKQKLVVLSLEEDSPRFGPKENVCLFQNDVKVACGKVMRANDSKAAVFIKAKRKSFRFEKSMELSIRSKDRNIASVSSEAASTSEVSASKSGGAPWLDIGLGALAGTNYLYPSLQLQLAISQNFTVGLLPLYVTAGGSGISLSGFGAMLGLQVYFGKKAFEGFFLQGGFGIISMTISDSEISESVSPFVGLGTVNYRLSITDNLDIGAGAGLQFFTTDSVNFTIGLAGLLPVFTSFVSYSL